MHVVHHLALSVGPIMEAAIFGWISAVSFPLGVAIAFSVSDPQRYRAAVCFLLAFASGAVCASLLIEVFADSVNTYIARAHAETQLLAMHPDETNTPLDTMAAESGVEAPNVDETAHCAYWCVLIMCSCAVIGAVGFLLIHRYVLSRTTWAKNEDEQLALTIILGQVVDGVPEACLIGLFTLRHELSLVLLLSLFIANLPESISVTLLQAMPVRTVAAIWSVLAFATGVLSALTASVFVAAFPTLQGYVLDDYAFAVLEGLASGSMLVVVAGQYLPDAAKILGNWTGVAFTFGIVCAAVVKTVGGTVSLGAGHGEGRIDLPNLTTKTGDLQPWGVLAPFAVADSTIFEGAPAFILKF
jgi:zinc transporter ZupT